MRSICTRLTGALLALAATTPLTAAANESGTQASDLVAVDGRDLGAYWRRSAPDHHVIELSGSDMGIYGCMAVPFVLRPEGNVELGLKPLLIKLGQASGEKIQKTDLYPIAVGALPEFEPVWDKPLGDSIYTSYPAVLVEAGIRSRLDDQAWTQLMDRLRRACDIQGLAEWVGRHPDRTVEEDLPSTPEQFLR